MTEFSAELEIKFSSSQYISLANTVGKFLSGISTFCFKKEGPPNYNSQAITFFSGQV